VSLEGRGFTSTGQFSASPRPLARDAQRFTSRAGRRGRRRFATGSAAGGHVAGEAREVLKPSHDRHSHPQRGALRGPTDDVDEAIAAAVAEAR
jgi:hypothetical protein